MKDANADQREYWTENVGEVWSDQTEPMDAALAPVLEATLDAAQLRPGAAVLDIGCGAGASTRRAAQRIGATGRVVGADISPTLLDAARTQSNYASNVTYVEADAQTYHFEPASFDTVISRFGVMFFSDFSAAFTNIRSALEPRGRIAFASWGDIGQNPYFTKPAACAKEVFGPMPKSDPDAPGPFALREIPRFHDTLSSAGFSDIAIEPTPVLLTPNGSKQEVVDLMLEIGPATRALREFNASDAQRDQLRELIMGAIEEFETPDGIQIPALINIATARNPA